MFLGFERGIHGKAEHYKAKAFKDVYDPKSQHCQK